MLNTDLEISPSRKGMTNPVNTNNCALNLSQICVSVVEHEFY
jgi:hypothetical protein